MEWLKKLDLTGKQFIKIVGLLVVALVVLTIVTNLLGSATGISFNDSIAESESYALGMPMGKSTYDYDDGGYGEMVPTMSGMPPVAPMPGGTTGADVEAYEVKEYTARIESRTLAEDCAAVRELKNRPEVIFENANEYLRGCSYTFKVENAAVASVLATLEALNPEELEEHSYSIKQAVTYYADEVTILENKLASLDKTLAEAVASYESLTKLATDVGDVESLVKVIDSKLVMIERLTNARIEASNRLDAMAKAKAEALDKTIYTYFSVSIYENKFVDGEEIKDSWQAAVKNFLRETNRLVQDLTIGLVAVLLMTIKFVLYFVLGLFLLRFGVTYTKRVWKGGEKGGDDTSR